MKKHYNKRHLKQAFSIIEVAIVIVIVGILIVGIVKGKDLYIAAKASTAKNLTTNSHIVRIKSLASWYEASTTDFGLGDRLKDDALLTNWPDISPFGKGLSRGASSLNCATATFTPAVAAVAADPSRGIAEVKAVAAATTLSASNNCKYIEDGISNIPAVSFSGGANFISSSSVERALSVSPTNFFASDNYYTILAVFSFRDKSNRQAILTIGNISLVYQPKNGTTPDQLLINSGGTESVAISDFSSKCLSVADSSVCSVVVSKSSASSSVYVNSVASASSSALPNFSGESILYVAGLSPSITITPAVNSFSGLISEVVLFNDGFNQKEIDKLMKEYIAKKYSIAIKE